MLFKLKYFVFTKKTLFGTNATPTKFPSKETELEQDKSHPVVNPIVSTVEPSKRVKIRWSKALYPSTGILAQQK